MFKNITLICILLLFVSSLAYAEPVTTLFDNFSSASNAGTLKRSEAKDHTVHCIFTNTSTITNLMVNFDGAIDNDNYETLQTHTFSATELAKKSAMFFVVDAPVPSVMANISSVTRFGDLSLGCKYWPFRSPNR